MAYLTAENSRFYFSRTFAATKEISAVTNDNPAEASATGHGFANTNELLIKSGWEDLNEMVLRAANVATNTFDLADFDSSDTTWFPPGSGAGTAQLISSWVEIPQILTVTTSGFEPRYTPVDPLAARNGIQIPTGFTPGSITLGLGYDPANVNYRTMLAASRRLEKVALKIVVGGGAVIYGYGNLTVGDMPQMAKGQVLTVNAAISMQRIFSYES